LADRPFMQRVSKRRLLSQSAGECATALSRRAFQVNRVIVATVATAAHSFQTAGGPFET